MFSLNVMLSNLPLSLLSGWLEADRAKWVNVEVSSDVECEEANAISGSSEGLVEGGVTQYNFSQEVHSWLLCYKHGSDDWRFYGGVTPTTQTGAVSSAEATSETQLTQATVSVTLEGNIDSFPAGSSARAELEAAFVDDLVSALGQADSRFEVLSVEAGSVVVTFKIHPTGWAHGCWGLES